jgi:hypothetical protein
MVCAQGQCNLQEQLYVSECLLAPDHHSKGNSGKGNNSSLRSGLSVERLIRWSSVDRLISRWVGRSRVRSVVGRSIEAKVSKGQQKRNLDLGTGRAKVAGIGRNWVGRSGLDLDRSRSRSVKVGIELDWSELEFRN